VFLDPKVQGSDLEWDSDGMLMKLSFLLQTGSTVGIKVLPDTVAGLI
tara:strand:- start:105 stop:245 length:141 start_codon:yes stop_codon:yes gene_type:complete